jgi:hypothetical protein
MWTMKLSKLRSGHFRFAALLFPWILLTHGAAFGGTFFVFVEETVDGEFLLEDVSPVSEGLLLGLFDRGHIVFDDSKIEPGFPWEQLDFSRFLETGRSGGAEYFVAAKVDTETVQLEPAEGKPTAIRYSSNVEFYCFDVEKRELLANGEIFDTNEGAERTKGRIDLGMELGNRLSASVEEICLGRMELASGDEDK